MKKQIIKKRIIFTIGAAFIISGCSAGQSEGCNNGKSTSSETELARIAIQDLVEQSQSHIPNLQKYSGYKDFKQKNPNCCFYVDGHTHDLKNQLGYEKKNQEIVIAYRKFEKGKSPYVVRFVSSERCSSGREYSERPMIGSNFREITSINWGRRIE